MPSQTPAPLAALIFAEETRASYAAGLDNHRHISEHKNVPEEAQHAVLNWADAWGAMASARQDGSAPEQLKRLAAAAERAYEALVDWLLGAGYDNRRIDREADGFIGWRDDGGRGHVRLTCAAEMVEPEPPSGKVRWYDRAWVRRP